MLPAATWFDAAACAPDLSADAEALCEADALVCDWAALCAKEIPVSKAAASMEKRILFIVDLPLLWSCQPRVRRRLIVKNYCRLHARSGCRGSLPLSLIFRYLTADGGVSCDQEPCKNCSFENN